MKTSVNCFINKTVISGKKFPTFSVTVKNPILPTYRPTRWSTHHRCVGRHTTNASADTLPTCRPTHYRHVGRLTTDASVDTLPTRRPTRGPTHHRPIDRNTYLPHLLCRNVGRPVGRIGFLTFTKFSVYPARLSPFSGIPENPLPFATGNFGKSKRELLVECKEPMM